MAGVLIWKPGNDGPVNSKYFLRSGPWTLAKSSVMGVWQYVLWRGKTRYPTDGPGYTTADEAKAVANEEETK